MSKKTVALIGVGYWGTKIYKYMNKYFNVPYAVNSKFDLEKIWNDDTIDGVIIATPIDTHYDIAYQALNSGKHVFCEKPVTLHTHEAIQLREIAQENNLAIAVDYVHTFSPSINRIRDAVAEKEILFIDASCKHLGRFMEFDVYWLLASHYMAVFDMFIPLKKLHFEFHEHIFNGKICTAGCINVFRGYGGRKIGQINVSLNYGKKENYMDVYTDGMHLRYDAMSDYSFSVVEYNKTEKALPLELIKKEEKYNIDESHNIRYALSYFNSLIDGHAKSNIDTAIRITEIIQYRRANTYNRLY